MPLRLKNEFASAFVSSTLNGRNLLALLPLCHFLSVRMLGAHAAHHEAKSSTTTGLPRRLVIFFLEVSFSRLNFFVTALPFLASAACEMDTAAIKQMILMMCFILVLPN